MMECSRALPYVVICRCPLLEQSVSSTCFCYASIDRQKQWLSSIRADEAPLLPLACKLAPLPLPVLPLPAPKCPLLPAPPAPPGGLLDPVAASKVFSWRS